MPKGVYDGKQHWTPERVELVKAKWSDGLSAARIAGLLGPGFTRNSVIGKIHRLGLSQRQKQPSKRAHRPRAQRPSLPRTPRPSPVNLVTVTPSMPPLRTVPVPDLIAFGPATVIEIPRGELVSLLMLTDKTCRWPMGDVGDPDFHFCGMQPNADHPYCEFHCRIAYERASSYRRGPFAPAENDSIREQWNGGENVPEIARQLRRKASTVWRQALVGLGLKTYQLEAAE